MFNTPSARFWTEEIGLKSVTLSFELNIAQAKGIECAQSGMLVYGRLPVMLMRNCIKKHCHQPEFLTDRQHQNFLITCDFGCRNRLWNSKRLYLADKQHPDFDRFSFCDGFLPMKRRSRFCRCWMRMRMCRKRFRTISRAVYIIGKFEKNIILGKGLDFW